MTKEFLARHKKPLGVIAISSLVFIILGLYAAFRDTSSVVSYEKLNAMVAHKEINKAVLSSQYIYLYTDKGTFSVPKSDKTQEIVLQAVPIEHSFEFLPFLIFSVVSLSVFAVIWKIASSYLNKRSSYGIIKAGAAKQSTDMPREQVYEIKSPLKFTDIAGVDEAKNELEEIVEFLKNPKLFKSKNIHMPKGVLLVGAPGVGKTLLARAVAGEAGVPFFYKSAATFVELYVGVGAKRVNELFLAAKRKAPSIIFIDEIDAIGKSRGGASSGERESTLNQLLVEMDGFEGSSGVIVIAATNKIEILDDALLRAGRFDRRVFVELPDVKGREEILRIYLKNKSHSLDIGSLARHTTGFSGAALANLVNEAAISSLKRGAEKIEDVDFSNVRNKVVYGTKRVSVLSERELGILSFYQAAKLLFAVKNEIAISYISQVEIRADEGDLEFKSGDEIKRLISYYLVGRAATNAYFGGVYYQSKTDYEKAMSITKDILFKFGLTKTQNVSHAEFLDGAESALGGFVREHKAAIQKLADTLKEDRHFELAQLEELGVL